MTALNDSAQAYLASMNATGKLRERVAYFVELYEKLLPEGTLTEVFLNDRVDEDGDRRFESLWLIGDEVVAECGNVLFESGNESWDLAIWGNLKQVVMDSERFDPEDIGPHSRLAVIWTNDQNLTGRFHATGENCRHLSQILKGRIMPALLAHGIATYSLDREPSHSRLTAPSVEE